MADSEKPSQARQWLTMLQLRLHLLRNGWLRTLGVVSFSPIIVFSLACIYLSLIEYYLSVGFNTQRLALDPTLYIARKNGPQSDLPPIILDNSSLIHPDVSGFEFAWPQLAYQVAPIDNSTFDYNLGLGAVFPVVWYRDTALHSPPVGLNVLNNFQLRSQNDSHSIKIVSAPIGLNMPPYPASDDRNDKPTGRTVIELDQFILVMPMGLVVLYIVSGTMLVNEHHCGAFDQLRCTGVSAFVYWSVQFVIDAVQYTLLAGLSFPAITLAAWFFSADVKYDEDVITCDILTMILYLPISMEFLYIIVILLRKSSIAFFGFVNTVLFFVVRLSVFRKFSLQPGIFISAVCLCSATGCRQRNIANAAVLG